jgi:putative transposase
LSVLVVSVACVKQVVKVRMLPTQEQAAALQATLNTCNEAASWLSDRMHAERVHRKHDVQKQFYSELKQRFGLSAQPAIRVIGKVADAYTTLRANIEAGNYGSPGSPKRKKVQETPIGFRADAAQPFDARCLSWQIPEQVGCREATVSIWTTQGRCKGVRVLAAPQDLVVLRTRPIGETDLIWHLVLISKYRSPCVPTRCEHLMR